jgi:hypothetical protein
MTANFAARVQFPGQKRTSRNHGILTADALTVDRRRRELDGKLVGITIVNARWLLERDGVIVVTPPQLRLEADELAPALAAA